jgi:hypothetical protein
LQTLSRPPVFVRPACEATGSTAARIVALSIAADWLPVASASAAAPLTRGVAIDVPLMVRRCRL